MKLSVGQTLSSAVDTTTVIVVKAPDADVAVACGGVEMYDAKTGAASSGEADPAHMGGTQLGKRYVDETGSIELLATKAGEASLSVDGVALTIKTAKPLPSSD
ncbi:hypothetical protein GEV29_12110 [Aeromicrobium sp. SMF47]|uniref:Uncharacterized protein n=1 Tax=Aeromicrobium yanjiei TaxID=2662028 RepID=A0A5Q2MKJ5_9ACTN|nr:MULTISPECIES: hypothetical protein [Aeromicrobium]MRJ77284.1 hypothetical protein [Aeromicrobium yanjiei]MRK01651.1 hypothetical protein [Aeromicrobium sp. S22]QGG41586.1 hypothetical protein GEV26_09560 [Aeromicrobium yanjiei]